MRITAVLAVVFSSALLLISCKNDIPGPPERGPVWIVYTQSSSPLLNNHVNALNMTSDAKLLIGTDSGASMFAIRDNSWSTFKDSLTLTSLKKVRAIAEGKDRSLWFGLLVGAARFNQYAQSTNRWERYSSELPSTAVTAIAVDRSQGLQTVYGEVWIGTSSGAAKYHQSDETPGQWTDMTSGLTTYLGTRQVTFGTANILDNHIWLGGQIGGAVEVFYDLAGYSWVAYTPTFDPGSQTNGIAFDLNNTVWLARNNGACSYNKSSGIWTYYTADSTGGRMPNTYCRAVETDLHSSRWFGTDSGLVGLRDTSWVKFTAANSPLPSDTVSALKYDFRGNLWIGTPRGLAVYNPEGTQF
jgi:ligand-binding sensor domain-containing protein